MKKITLQGAINVRDFGDTPVQDGRKIHKHRLIRSDLLARLVPEDVRALRDEYKLGTVIDLRTETERLEQPDVRIDGVKYLHLPISKEETLGISREKKIADSFRETDMPDMREVYRQMVNHPYSQGQFRAVLTAIMAPSQGAKLWHCTAGKDRCGMTSVLVQHMLGVDRDTIFADYMLSNEAAMPVAQRFYEMILQATQNERRAEGIRCSFIADPSYLDAALDEMERMCGGIDGYIDKVLGIKAEQIMCFREANLE